MQKDKSAVNPTTDPEDRPMYIWLKEPLAPFSTIVDNNIYLVYPSDDGTDRPSNPYGQH